jgi:hypothetical protein
MFNRDCQALWFTTAVMAGAVLAAAWLAVA